MVFGIKSPAKGSSAVALLCMKDPVTVTRSNQVPLWGLSVMMVVEVSTMCRGRKLSRGTMERKLIFYRWRLIRRDKSLICRYFLSECPAITTDPETSETEGVRPKCIGGYSVVRRQSRMKSLGGKNMKSQRNADGLGEWESWLGVGEMALRGDDSRSKQQSAHANETGSSVGNGVESDMRFWKSESSDGSSPGLPLIWYMPYAKDGR